MILILCTSPLHLLTSISIKRDYYRDKDVSVLLLDHSAHLEELKLEVFEHVDIDDMKL